MLNLFIFRNVRIAGLQEQIKTLEDKDREGFQSSKEKQEQIDVLNKKLEEANKLISDYKLELEGDQHLKKDLLDYNREILELRKVITNLEAERVTLDQKIEQQSEVNINTHIGFEDRL